MLAGGDTEDFDSETGLPKDDKLRKAIEGIENRVKFLGPQSQEELALLFNSATATIVPSFYESFGMVAAEAQACGSPVIASNVGGLKNVVQDGISGLLVETKNEIDLAIAMDILSANALLTERLSRQAEKIARKDFDWDSISSRINTLYEVIIHARSNAFISNRSGRDTRR